MSEYKQLDLKSITKQDIVRILIKFDENVSPNSDQYKELQSLKAKVDDWISAFKSGRVDSPIGNKDLIFYTINISKVLDGKPIGSKATKLADIMHKCLNPNSYDIKSKSGLGLKQLKNAKTMIIGDKSDVLGEKQHKLRENAKNTVKNAVKKNVSSVSSKIKKKSIKENWKGKIAGGIAGAFGLEDLDSKIQEYFEKRNPSYDDTEDKLEEILKSKEESDKESLKKYVESLNKEKEVLKQLDNKNSNLRRLSEKLLDRISTDEKELKALTSDSEGSKFLRRVLDSKLEINSELREKIKNSLDKQHYYTDDDDEDEETYEKLHTSNDRKKLNSQSQLENNNVLENLDQFFKTFSEVIQPKAIQENRKLNSESTEVLSETLPVISDNTKNTIENITKVDHSLDQGFINLSRKVSGVEEGTDRIANLLEKQISLQRKMLDNGSSSVSKGSKDKDEKDEEELSLRDLKDSIDDWIDGDSDNKKKKKGKKNKKGKKGKNSSKPKSKPTKSPSTKPAGKLGKFGKILSGAKNVISSGASKILSPLGGVAQSVLPNAASFAGKGGALTSGAKILGKVALPLTALMTAYDAVQGFDKDKADALGFNGDSTKGKLNSASASAVSGLTFGLIDEETIAKGIKLQDSIQDGIVDAFGGKDSVLGGAIDKLVNPFDNIADGFDRVVSWFNKEESKESAQPSSEQKKEKPVDEKELMNKVLSTAENLNPAAQYEKITENIFDAPGAKEVWDKLTDKESIMESALSPMTSVFGGMWDSVKRMFSSKPESTPSSNTSNSPSQFKSLSSLGSFGSGGVPSGSINIGQYGGTALGDGDIGTSPSIGKLGDVKALLDYGMSFVGKCTYSMGSKDPTTGKCDCSGFVKFLYSRVWGVKDMPDGAAYQFTWNKGRVINKLEDLQPGDIYFMNSPSSHAIGRPLGISHVGIYAGGGNLLHCSSSGKGVNLMPLNNYYKQWFVGAKRLTESGGVAGITSPQSENSPNMTIPSSNPAYQTGQIPSDMTGGALTDPNNPNSTGTPDGFTPNPSAIPYRQLSSENADKNASEQGLKARDEFIKQSLESGVSKNDIAVMLGQLDHESGGFKKMTENLNYSSAERIQQVFGRSLNGVDPRTLVNNPQALANVVYGQKNGNKGGEDGWNFRGRGLVGLTGRANYEAASKAIGVDLVSNPDLASDPAVAAKVAMWWQKSKVGYGANAAQATKRINGNAMMGLDDRIARTQDWQGGRLDKEIARIQGQSGTDTKLPQQTAGVEVKASGQATSIPETVAAPKPIIAQNVQSLPITEKVKAPPTKSQELQQANNLVNSQQQQYSPSPKQSLASSGGDSFGIKWKDWIEDSSLTALQKLANGGLG